MRWIHALFELPTRYAVLYTCPPRRPDDARLACFLAQLAPTPERFVYISTTGVYGELRRCRGRRGVTPLNPGSEMSRPRVAAEKLLGAWANSLGCELVVLRVAGHLRSRAARHRAHRAGRRRSLPAPRPIRVTASMSMTSRPAALRHCQNRRRRASTTWEMATTALQPGLPSEVARQAETA